MKSAVCNGERDMLSAIGMTIFYPLFNSLFWTENNREFFSSTLDVQSDYNEEEISYNVLYIDKFLCDENRIRTKLQREIPSLYRLVVR